MISNVWFILITILIAFLLLICAGLGYVLATKNRKINRINNDLQQNSQKIDDLQAKLKQAIEKNKEIEQLKSAFLCNISHEIRTPLNAITGFCDLIASPSEKDSQKIQYANIISRNVDALLELVNDILDISQIESGSITVDKKEVKVNELISAVQTYYNLEKTKIGKSHLQISLNKGNKDNSFAFFGDPYKIRRILNNLVENSLKFTSEGIIEIGYKLDSNKMITFFVKDEGIGMSKDEMNKIFERFRQADERSTRQYGGLGLGLTVAQQFTDLMGGKIWAESEPGQGTNFFFSVPFHTS
jgi:signal transduction histidine kinase